jgi:hypothetical protein
MTPEPIRELALQLYTIVFESEGVAELTVWQRCLHTCQRWDVEPSTAILISEALTGYLYDGSRPQVPLVTPLARAQAVLHQTATSGKSRTTRCTTSHFSPSGVCCAS